MDASVDERFNVNQQCALAALRVICTLSCTKRSVTSREKGGDSAPLLSSCETAPGAPRPVLGPPTKKEMQLLGGGPEEGCRYDQRAGAPPL